MQSTNVLEHQQTSKDSLIAWIICISASLFFFYEFIQGNMFASIGDALMRDFHINANTMAFMSSIYYISNVLFLFVAAYILDHYSPKKTLLISMALSIFGTFLLAVTHSFSIAVICRFITGIGSAFCFLGPVRIASRWFPSHRMALVTGIIVTIAMMGGMIAQHPLTQLVMNYGWRHSLLYLGYLGIGIFVLMLFGIQERTEAHATANNKQKISATHTYLNWKNIAPAAYTSLMNMAIAVWGAMMGTAFLKQRLAIDASQASYINSLLFLGVIFGGPIIGWFSDKMSLRVLPMKWGMVTSLMCLLLILYASVTPTTMGALFFLLGFFTSSQVISYALVAESNSPLVTARAISVISILTQGGFIVYQNLYSHLLVHFDTNTTILDGVPLYSLTGYQVANTILIIGLLIAGALTYFMKETNGKAWETN